MLQVSKFYGIVISMNFGDHNPPHFHARYGEHEALFAIDQLSVIRGKLPARAESLVIEWAGYHQPELMANWERVTTLTPIEHIEPLD